MRVTLDTNVLIAAFISRGVCHELFEYLIRHHAVVTSEHILDEFREVLANKIRVTFYALENLFEQNPRRAES